jgi:PKD repeat protein
VTLPQPYPPGQEIATVANGDQAHAGNVVPIRVKLPGEELSRVWPDGTLPGMPGQPPTASFTYTPPSPGTNTNVTFDGTGSTAALPSQPITRYDWLFNNTTGASGVTAAWRTPNKSGSYPVTLTVTASDDQQGSQTQVITF